MTSDNQEKIINAISWFLFILALLPIAAFLVCWCVPVIHALLSATMLAVMYVACLLSGFLCGMNIPASIFDKTALKMYEFGESIVNSISSLSNSLVDGCCNKPR
jgi:hypothetical protein